MAHYSRREFLKTGLAAGALASAGGLSLKAERQTATDWVTLGKSGVKVTRLAFGTGSFSGQVQRDLGQEQFTRLVRHAHERGVRFFETAESYDGMHEMLGMALQGVPRDSYRLMTKVTTHDGVNPQEKIDELRKLAKTDYFDIVLLHCQHTPTWPTDSLRWQDGISGSSVETGCVIARCVGARAAGAAPGPGKQVARSCHDPDESKGREDGRGRLRHLGLGNVSEVVTHVKQARKAGMGVISMKLVGEGSLRSVRTARPR